MRQMRLLRLLRRCAVAPVALYHTTNGDCWSLPKIVPNTPTHDYAYDELLFSGIDVNLNMWMSETNVGLLSLL